MKNQISKDFMGVEPIGKLLKKLSLPAMVGMLANALYNLVDTIFVGHGVGPMAIAGISVAFPIQMLVGAFALTFGVGAASISSRRLGEKNEKAAAKAAGNAIVMTIITSLLISLIGLLFLDPILSFLGASETILPFSRDYLSIILYGALFVSFSMCSNNLIRAEGNAKASMFIMLSGMVLNIILDPIFIFGLKLGIRGAALATVISQVVSSIIALSFFLKKKSILQFTRNSFKLSFKLIKETVLLGTSTFIRQIGTSIITVLMNNILGVHGGDAAIATYGMINRLAVFFLLPSFGVNQGLQPIAGYNYGAKFYDRVKKVLKLSTIWTSLIGLSGSVLCVLFPRTLLGMFTTDETVLSMAVPALRIVMSTMTFVGIQACGATYFQSIGKSAPAILLGLSRQFLVLIPVLLILPNLFGLVGIWLSFPIADLVATIITSVYTLSSLKKLK